MYREVYDQIVAKSMEPEAKERSVAYLAEHLGRFLKKDERVLICFSNRGPGTISDLMEEAVARCGGIPEVWGPDHRWKTLLRQAFSQKVRAIIGAPLIVLGLTKLAKHKATPLSIRRVITAGYPCAQWMIDGIVKGFDCEMGGCFALSSSSAVAGFACGHSWGVHLRTEEYGVDIVDSQGNLLPDGELGEMVFYPRSHPELRFPTGENARIAPVKCRCGSDTPRLIDMQYGRTEDQDLAELGHELQSWTSILDCRIRRSEFGLEIELVTFPGEKLPKLPNAAKLVIRPWNPEVDEPFYYNPVLQICP